MKNRDRMARNLKAIGLTLLIGALIWLPVGLLLNLPRGSVIGSSLGIMAGTGLGYLIVKAVISNRTGK